MTLLGSFADVDTIHAAEADVAKVASPVRSERETPVVLAIRRCNGSVVNIHGQKTVKSAAESIGATGDSGRQVNGMGTGIVIDSRGYVITNYHVVEDVDQVRITLADGTNTTAEVIGTDIRSDLALLKVSTTTPLETIPRGTSSDLMVGEPVIAIGNAYGYVHTATEGIISALHRDVPVNDTQEYSDLIQTSAGINPGNSGGPLLNIHGEIIGINVAVRMHAQQIAFAIPIDQAIDIVNDLIGSQNEDRLSMGMRVEGGPKVGEGVVVAQVSAGGPAAAQDIRVGDRIVSVGEQKVDDRLDFGLSLIESQQGQELMFKIERDGKPVQVALISEPPFWASIGVKVQPITKSTTQTINSRIRRTYPGGLYVTEVRKGSPAFNQGIRVGDVLVGFHGYATASTLQLQSIIEMISKKDSTQGQFNIVRNYKEMYTYVQLAEAPGVKRR